MTRMITISKCQCGHKSCRYYHLEGIGQFYQGTGFEREDAERIAAFLNEGRPIGPLDGQLRTTLEVRAGDAWRQVAQGPLSKQDMALMLLKQAAEEIDDIGALADIILALQLRVRAENNERLSRGLGDCARQHG